MKHHYVQGLCIRLEIPTEVFYPDNDHKGKIAYAKSICSNCDKQSECLDLALARREEFGIWGGLTYAERTQFRAQQALRNRSSQRKKPHEQEHPLSACSSSPSHISDEENHNPSVYQLDFARQLASRVDGIEVSLLQLPEGLSLGPNQSSLFELLWAELSSSRLQPDHTLEIENQVLIKIDLELSQIEGPSDSDLSQLEQDPILSIPLDLIQV